MKNRIELLKPKLPKDVKVLRDLDGEDFTPKQVLLTPRQLAEQLQVPLGFVKAFLGERKLHEASFGERRAKSGLMSEELAALSAVGMLAMRHGLAAEKCGSWFVEIVGELYQAVKPSRVVLSVLNSNKKTEVHLSVGVGQMEEEFSSEAEREQMKKYIRHYDLTWLKFMIEMALNVEPLKLPGAMSAEVTS